MRRWGFGAALLSLFLLFSCQGKGYKRIAKDQLKDLLVDLYVADGYFVNIYDPELTDSVREAVYADIFSKHGTTRRDYDSTLVWYARNDLNEYIVICQAVREELEQQRLVLDARLTAENERLAREFDGTSYQLDSVNLLRHDSARVYWPDMPLLNCPFVIRPGTAYGDSTRLEFVTRVRGLRLRPMARMEMGLQLICTDSSSVVLKQKVENGLNILTAMVPDSAKVMRVYGYLQGFPDSTGIIAMEPFVVDSFSVRKFTVGPQ